MKISLLFLSNINHHQDVLTIYSVVYIMKHYIYKKQMAQFIIIRDVCMKNNNHLKIALNLEQISKSFTAKSIFFGQHYRVKHRKINLRNKNILKIHEFYQFLLKTSNSSIFAVSHIYSSSNVCILEGSFFMFFF